MYSDFLDQFSLDGFRRALPGYFTSVSADSDETKVGMARCAVPAVFSGGTFSAQGYESIAG